MVVAIIGAVPLTVCILKSRRSGVIGEKTENDMLNKNSMQLSVGNGLGYRFSRFSSYRMSPWRQVILLFTKGPCNCSLCDILIVILIGISSPLVWAVY